MLYAYLYSKVCSNHIFSFLLAAQKYFIYEFSMITVMHYGLCLL